MFPFLQFPSFQFREESELRDAFRALRAVDPASARPSKDLPTVHAAAFDNLLARGTIREGAPGTFYLYEPPAVPLRLVRQLLFWLALIIIPVAIIQYCPGSP